MGVGRVKDTLGSDTGYGSGDEDADGYAIDADADGDTDAVGFDRCQPMIVERCRLDTDCGNEERFDTDSDDGYGHGARQWRVVGLDGDGGDDADGDSDSDDRYPSE